MKLLIRIHVLSAAVAASYATLGFADRVAARNLWAYYAAVSLALALFNLYLLRRHR